MRSRLTAPLLRRAKLSRDPTGQRRRLRSRAMHDALAAHRSAPPARQAHRRPYGSAPPTALSCPARCARGSPLRSSGAPGSAATLRVSAADCALVPCTMRSRLTAPLLRRAKLSRDPTGQRRRLCSRALHDALAAHRSAPPARQAHRRPYGSAPPTALSCPARCARGSPLRSSGAPGSAATLRVSAADYTLVPCTMRSRLAAPLLRRAKLSGDPTGQRRRLCSRALHDALTAHRSAPPARRLQTSCRPSLRYS